MTGNLVTRSLACLLWRCAAPVTRPSSMVVPLCVYFKCVAFLVLSQGVCVRVCPRVTLTCNATRHNCRSVVASKWRYMATPSKRAFSEAAARVDSDGSCKVRPTAAPECGKARGRARKEPAAPPPMLSHGQVPVVRAALTTALARDASGTRAVCRKFIFHPHYAELSPTWRADLVNWLLPVSTSLSMAPRTLGLAVQFLDRMMSTVALDKGNITAFAMVALVVAFKLNEPVLADRPTPRLSYVRTVFGDFSPATRSPPPLYELSFTFTIHLCARRPSAPCHRPRSRRQL